MDSFKLDSGISVYFNHFICNATYSGLIEGNPAKSNWINDNIFNRLACPKDWGTRKTFIIHPGEQAMKNFLPPATYTVWLESREHADPQMDGSELVVIWFDDAPAERSIKEIVESGVKGIDWKKHAEEFQY